MRGKRVGLSASQDNDTLYLGNICKTWTKDNVRFFLTLWLIGYLLTSSLPPIDWHALCTSMLFHALHVVSSFGLYMYGCICECIAQIIKFSFLADATTFIEVSACSNLFSPFLVQGNGGIEGLRN